MKCLLQELFDGENVDAPPVVGAENCSQNHLTFGYKISTSINSNLTFTVYHASGVDCWAFE